MTLKETVFEALGEATGLSNEHLTIIVAVAVVIVTALAVWSYSSTKKKPKCKFSRQIL